MENLIKRSKLWFLIALSVFVVNACQHSEDVEQPASSKNLQENPLGSTLTDESKIDHYNSLIDQLDIEVHELAFYEKGVLINGDMAMAYDALEWWATNAPELSESGRVQHWKHSVVVNSATVSSIDIYVTPSSGMSSSGFSAAFDQAIAQWNDIYGTVVRFNQAGSAGSADIVVNDYYQSGTSTVAWAYLPFNANTPGDEIWVNTYYSTLSASQKLNAAIHEMGHNIGLRHTDQSVGTFIQGTPSSDPFSVMHATVHNYYGFTGGDVIASQILWPDNSVLNFMIVRPGDDPVDNGGPLYVSWDPGRFGSYTSNVKIDLYKEGSLYNTLASSASGYGSYTHQSIAYVPPGHGYQIRLENINTGLFEFTKPFEIY